MITMNKQYEFGLVILAFSVLLSGCEIIDNLRSNNTETVTTSAVETEPHPAPVIEPFYEQPSNWRPILPHELDAHFEESEALLNLMRYSRRLGELTTAELDQEYQSFKSLQDEQLFTMSKQLQLALLLSTANASFHNTEEAKKILSAIINTNQKRGVVLREYAYSLLVTIEQNQKSQQQNLTLRKKLKKEIERRQQLEQKLEALKSIEESITQRQNNPEE